MRLVADMCVARAWLSVDIADFCARAAVLLPQIVSGINQSWLVPIQIIVIIVLLSETIGVATISGLAVMLIMLPLMAVVRCAVPALMACGAPHTILTCLLGSCTGLCYNFEDGKHACQDCW